MKTVLKIFGLIFLAFYFTACAGNSGGGSSDGSGSGTPIRVPDTTPHDYHFVMGRPTTGSTGAARLVWTCNTGYSNPQDYTFDRTFTDGNPNFGVLCQASKNISIRIQNTGTIDLILEFTYDGVYQWQATLIPGQVYTLTRGF
jgi:hypothetical protein